MQPEPLQRKMDYNQQANNREVEEIICLSDDDEDKPFIKIEKDPDDDKKILTDSEDAQCVLLEDAKCKKLNYDDAQSNNLKTSGFTIRSVKPEDDYESSESSSSDDDEHKMQFDGFQRSNITAGTRKNQIRTAFYKRCNEKTDRTQYLYMKTMKYYKEYQCEVLRMRIRRSAEKLAGMTKDSRQLMLDSNRLTEQTLLRKIVPELLDPNQSPNPFWN